MRLNAMLVAGAALLCAALVSAQNPPKPYDNACLVGQAPTYNKTHANDVKWYDLDLDQPPEMRWKQIASDHADHIKNLVGVIKTLIRPLFHGKLIAWVDKHMGAWDNHFVEPYHSELMGIAEASNVTMGEIVFYNIFYEIFSVCTSIVAADSDGNLVHARNLDFGLFMGWDHATHNWQVYNALQPMIVNVRWMKGGKVLFKSVNFAGYIGVYNAVKQNAFSITMNERFNIVGGYLGIIEWLFGLNKKSTFSTYLVREAMLNADSYEAAIDYIVSKPIIAPAYYIVGGVKAPQGAVITRGLNNVVSVVRMNMTSSNSAPWYVLETNYDPDTTVFYLDDRRTPGNDCMKQLSQKDVSFAGIHQVLSSKTNLNKETAYTVLMKVATGEFETHLQSCPQPCWPW